MRLGQSSPPYAVAAIAKARSRHRHRGRHTPRTPRPRRLRRQAQPASTPTPTTASAPSPTSRRHLRASTSPPRTTWSTPCNPAHPWPPSPPSAPHPLALEAIRISNDLRLLSSFSPNTGLRRRRLDSAPAHCSSAPASCPARSTPSCPNSPPWSASSVIGLDTAKLSPTPSRPGN